MEYVVMLPPESDHHYVMINSQTISRGFASGGLCLVQDYPCPLDGDKVNPSLLNCSQWLCR
jgi:hypothetical protein